MTPRRLILAISLSEILCLNPERLSGILAIEAARCGEVKAALSFCKVSYSTIRFFDPSLINPAQSIFENMSESESGAVLTSVATRLSAYACSTPSLFANSSNSKVH